MRGFLWLASTVLLLWSTPATAQPAGVKAVATVRQLHDAVLTPASDAIFKAQAEPPVDDAGWVGVRNNAILLAESGNLLMLGTRARDRRNWMKLSREMVDAGAALMRSTDTKSADALSAAADQLLETCHVCHEVYRDQGRSMRR